MIPISNVSELDNIIYKTWADASPPAKYLSKAPIKKSQASQHDERLQKFTWRRMAHQGPHWGPHLRHSLHWFYTLHTQQQLTQSACEYCRPLCQVSLSNAFELKVCLYLKTDVFHPGLPMTKRNHKAFPLPSIIHILSLSKETINDIFDIIIQNQTCLL